jgi:raffinose/stachyose/melibiose transport system permease protein
MDIKKRSPWVLIFVLPCFLIYTIVAIWPLFQSLYYSFFTWRGFGAMKFAGLSNYVKLFSGDHVIRTALQNTVTWAFVSLVVLIPVSLLIANSLNSGIKYSDSFSTIFYLPGILSTVIISLMWTSILNADYGIFNNILETIGLTSLTRVWLGDPKTAMYVVILVTCWQWTGYHMLIFFASIQSIPGSIYEAANLDGVNGFSRLFRITIPLMASTIKINVILLLIGTLKAFDSVYVMTSGGPADSTQMPATYMYENTFHRFNYGYGSAISMMIFVLGITVSVVLQRWRFGRETIQY